MRDSVYEPSQEEIEQECARIRETWSEETERARRSFAWADIHEPSIHDSFVWCRCGSLVGFRRFEFVRVGKIRGIRRIVIDAQGHEVFRTCCKLCLKPFEHDRLNLGAIRYIEEDWNEQWTCDQPPWWEQIDA